MSLFGWLFRRKPRRPGDKEIARVEKTRRELTDRREKLLYEAMELDEEIARLFEKYQETDKELLKRELRHALTVKRAAYKSIEARLGKIGESELSMTRRSAFLQSFLDLPEITDEDLHRLEELQSVRKEQERKGVLYTDKVIALTEMAPERSVEAERLEQETIDKLEAEARSRLRETEQKNAAEARSRREEMERLERAASKALDEPAELPAKKSNADRHLMEEDEA